MTESKDPRLSEGFVVTEDALRTALDEFRANLIAMAMLEAPSAPVEKCGQPAASFIPRWGMSWACVLPKGHEGEHKRGGNCFMHGEYAGEKCPQWPNCISTPAPASQPVSAPAETKEWVTADDLCVQIHLKLTASSQSKHFGWLVGALELAEVRAALKEAEWWYERIKNYDSIFAVRGRISRLADREAELLARGGAKP